MKLLPREFYARDTVLVAKELLGKIMHRQWRGLHLSGVIVETEAYCGLIDPASHAYVGETNRNRALFGEVGHSYVYFTYGNHYCVNIVAREKDVAAGGVLIRALLPLDGINHMQKLRHTDIISNLTSGPGKIGQALHLRLSNNLIDLAKEGPLYLTEGFNFPKGAIGVTPRIGISKAIANPWRFMVNREESARLQEHAQRSDRLTAKRIQR